MEQIRTDIENMNEKITSEYHAAIIELAKNQALLEELALLNPIALGPEVRLPRFRVTKIETGHKFGTRITIHKCAPDLFQFQTGNLTVAVRIYPIPSITTNITTIGRLCFEGKVVRTGNEYSENDTRITIPGVKSTSILKRGEDNIVRVVTPLSFYSENETIVVDFAPIRVKLGKVHALTIGDSPEIYFGRGLFFRYRGEFYFYVNDKTRTLGVKVYHSISRKLVSRIPGVIHLFVVGDDLIACGTGAVFIMRPRLIGG